MAKKMEKEIVAPETLRQERNKEEAKKPPKHTLKERVDLEYEIRKYVAKHGGYRKALSESDKRHCGKLLLRRQGDLRSKLKWDFNITIPGMDKPSVADIVQVKNLGMPEVGDV